MEIFFGRMSVDESTFLGSEMVANFPTQALKQVLLGFLKNSNYRHAIFHQIIVELGTRTDIPEFDIEQLVGLVLHKAIEADDIDSLIDLFRTNIVKKFSEKFYPGLVTYCVKRALAVGPDPRVPLLWAASVSSKILTNEDNIKFSLLALNKLGETSSRKDWLSDLALTIANMASPGSKPESEFLSHALTSMHTISKFSDRQLEIFSLEVCEKIHSNLKMLESLLTSGDVNRWSSAERLMAIGSTPEMRAMHLPEFREDSLDEIITESTGIDWLALTHVIKKLDWEKFVREEKDFSDLVIFTILGKELQRRIEIPLHRNLRRFLILSSLGVTRPISRKTFFKFSVEIVSDSDCELLRRMSGFFKLKFTQELCPGSLLVAEFKESVFDSIVGGIRDGTCEGPEIASVVTELIRSGLDDSLLIDLVREIISLYSPRTAPLWSMELLLVIGNSLEQFSPSITDNDSTREPDESTLMNPTELIALELIAYLKFFIDISVHEEAKTDPIANANICFVKSVFALRTISCCLRVFVSRYSQIFIVKLCDIWMVLSVYFPDVECKWTDEDELRFLFGLELVASVTESESAKEFFKNRFEELIQPLAVSYPKDRFSSPVGTKIFPLMNKLVDSGVITLS